MIAPAFTYSSADHIYRLDGALIPGLSQVLVAQGLRHHRGDEAAMARGREVHRLTALDDMEASDGLPMEYVGYVGAWAKARKDLDLTLLHIEEPIASLQHRYGCTPDRVARVRGEYHAVVELKTGSPDPADGIQLAAQAIAARDTYGLTVIPRRIAVYLIRDGTSGIKEYTDPTRSEERRVGKECRL